MLAGYVLQGSGAGWLLASPVFYLAWNFIQSLVVGCLIIGLATNLSVLSGLRAVKARRGESS
jgi:hypothetical protein